MTWRWSLLKSAAPAVVDPEEQQLTELQNGPMGQQMNDFIAKNKQKLQPGAARQWQQWQTDPLHSRLFTRLSLKAHPTVPDHKRFINNLKNAPVDEPAAPESQPQGAEAQPQEPFSIPVFLEGLMGKIVKNFNLNQKGMERILAGVPRALWGGESVEGTTMGPKSKKANWRSWLLREPMSPGGGGKHRLQNTSVELDAESYTAQGLDPDKAWKKALADDLAKGTQSEALQAISQAVDDADPELLELFKEAGGKEESQWQGKGTDMGKPGAEKSTNIFNLHGVDKRTGRGQNTDPSAQTQETIGERGVTPALEQTYADFLTNEGNRAFMDQYRPALEGMKDPEKALNLSIRYALLDETGTGDDEHPEYRWQEFFVKNPNLLPPEAQNSPLEWLRRNPDQAMKILQGMAQNPGGSPAELQKFLDPLVKDALQRVRDSEKIDLSNDWEALVRDLNRLKNTTRAVLLHTYKRAAANGQDANSIGRRYWMIKTKLDLAVPRMKALLDGVIGEINLDDDDSDETAELDEKATSKKNKVSIYRIGKGRIGLKQNGVMREINPEDFTTLSNIVRPKEWVAPLLERMKLSPQLLKKAYNLEPTKLKNGDQIIDAPLGIRGKSPLTPVDRELINATEQWLSQNQPKPPVYERAPGFGGNDGKLTQKGDDRLTGYRKKLGEILKNAMIQAGQNPQQVALAIKNRAGHGPKSGPNLRNPDAFINAVLNGQPTRYSVKDFNVIAGVLGIPVENIYAEPTEYDEYCMEDVRANVPELVRMSFQDYAPGLLDRKRKAAKKGIPFYAGKTMQVMLGMLRVHGALYKDKIAKPQIDELVEEPNAQLGSGSEIYDKIPTPSRERENTSLQHSRYVRDQNGEIKQEFYEPDIIEQAKKLRIPIPANNTRGKKHELYMILDGEINGDKQDAARQLEQIRQQIAKIPAETRKKMQLWKLPQRPVYEPNGMKKVQSVDGNIIIHAMAQIERLAMIRERLCKFADVSDVDNLIDDFTDRAIEYLNGTREF